MRIFIKKTRKVDFQGINSIFQIVENMKKVKVFKTFFLILKLDIKKCPKSILKKKFVKTKTTFFSTFFLQLFFLVLNDKW